MAQKEPMTIEKAEKAIKHIQKVFYIVGGINLLYSFYELNLWGGFFPGIVISIGFGFLIIAMGWALGTGHRTKVPTSAIVLSIALLVYYLVTVTLTKTPTVQGLIFAVALFIIGRQSQEAVKVLESSKVSPQKSR